MKWWNFNPGIKMMAAEFSRYVYNENRDPVVIASTGRSGSTMISRAIMSSYFQNKYSIDIDVRFVFYPAFIEKNNDYFKSGGVYKTHLLSEKIPLNLKTIFIYDDPIVSYESFKKCVEVYGSNWGSQHLLNLESKYGIDKLDSNIDILNYKSQITSWSERESGVVVRFSELWNNIGMISDYIGTNIKLPLLKKRFSIVSEDYVASDCQAELKGIYYGAPDIIIK